MPALPAPHTASHAAMPVAIASVRAHDHARGPGSPRYRQPAVIGSQQQGHSAAWGESGCSRSRPSNELFDKLIQLRSRCRPAVEAPEAHKQAADDIGNGTAFLAHAQAPHGQFGSAEPNYGYARNLRELYTTQREIGRGGNGIVTAVQRRSSGICFACKSIAKTPLDIAKDASKLTAHMNNVKREIRVMQELRSCLNVARLEAVFEDDESVHIVQELCTGGELAHSIGDRHYSERTVASYMRAVLKTLAQCHAHNILHRDVKPGNFMLASDADDARIKAIDFGLAVPFNDGDDLTDLVMEGTPWFLAPETLSSKWSTKSDVWAAGVMAHQLLSGHLPFNDKRSPRSPALSAVLRSILTDKLNFGKSYWSDISEDAKDFVTRLLERDPAKRPTAAEALSHPWLEGSVADRQKGRPLSMNVVQRIQRFGRAGVLERSMYALMAEELIKDDARHESDALHVDDEGHPIMDCAHSCALKLVLRYLQLDSEASVDRDTIAAGLQKMGYRLQTGELDRLCCAIAGNDGVLSRASVIASQLDWHHIQQFQKDRWLAIARRTFDHLDEDSNGTVTLHQMISAIKHKLPAEELQAVYEAALPAPHTSASAGPTLKASMSFGSFVGLLQVPTSDSLDLYDDHLDVTASALRAHAQQWVPVPAASGCPSQALWRMSEGVGALSVLHGQRTAD